MTGSLIYSNASIYEAVMRALYGRGYNERLRSVAELIAEGSSVLDVCCGPGTLFHRYLKTKGVHYTGLDINRHFVERLAAGGQTVISMADDSHVPETAAAVWHVHEGSVRT